MPYLYVIELQPGARARRFSNETAGLPEGGGMRRLILAMAGRICYFVA
jgi:hypothetical protein